MPTPYEEALTRINAAKESGGTKLDVSGLELDILPPEIWDLNTIFTLLDR